MTSTFNSPSRSVLLVTDNLRSGGVQAVVLQLARLLTQRGWRVGIAAEGGELASRLVSGVSFHRLRNRRDWLAIRRLVRRHRYQIVHAHQRGIALGARLVLSGMGVTVVEHVHNTFSPPTKKLTSFRSPLLIACGSTIEQMLTEEYGRPRSSVRLVRNSVPDPGSPRRSSEPKNRIRLVSIGRMVPQKDPLRALTVMEHLERSQPRTFSLEWAGGGPLGSSFAHEASERNLPVQWLGPVPDASALLDGADALLLTSRWEGLPLVALEALARGVPIIAPDVGSCRDAVINEQTGVLYRPNSSATEIAQLIQVNSQRLVQWRENCRNHYLATFSEARFIEEIENAYKSIL